MGFKEISLEAAEWVKPARNSALWCALMDTVIKVMVPQKTENFLTS